MHISTCGPEVALVDAAGDPLPPGAGCDHPDAAAYALLGPDGSAAGSWPISERTFAAQFITPSGALSPGDHIYSHTATVSDVSQGGPFAIDGSDPGVASLSGTAGPPGTIYVSNDDGPITRGMSWVSEWIETRWVNPSAVYPASTWAHRSAALTVVEAIDGNQELWFRLREELDFLTPGPGGFWAALPETIEAETSSGGANLTSVRTSNSSAAVIGNLGSIGARNADGTVPPGGTVAARVRLRLEFPTFNNADIPAAAGAPGTPGANRVAATVSTQHTGWGRTITCP